MGMPPVGAAEAGAVVVVEPGSPDAGPAKPDNATVWGVPVTEGAGAVVGPAEAEVVVPTAETAAVPDRPKKETAPMTASTTAATTAITIWKRRAIRGHLGGSAGRPAG